MPSSPVRLVGCDDPGPSDPVRITNISEIAAGMALENVITVSASGGDYPTLEDALNSITASGPTNRYQILIGPGNYTENNPLPTKQYVVVTGSSEATTVLVATNPNADMFTSAQFTILESVIISGVSGTGWVYDVTSAHSIQLRGVTFSNCERGVRQNNASSSVGLKDIRIFSPAIPATVAGAVCNAGVMEIDRLRVEQLTSVTTVIEADGANADVQVTNSTSQQSGVTTYLNAKNDAVVKMDTMTLANMTDCIVMESANVRVVASTIVDVGQDALRIENAGAAPVFSGDGLTVDNPGRYSFNVLHPSAVVSGFGTADLSKINSVSGALLIASIVDLTSGDEGTNFLGEIHGGTPEFPAEAAFGGGDSTVRGMIVYTYSVAGGIWTDVTVAASSDTGSTFTFPGVAADNAIYIATSLANTTDVLQHFGIKSNCTIAAVLGGGSFAVEYWNGASWVSINHMSTLSTGDLTAYAKDIFERVQSEQIYYPDAFLSLWSKNDPMALGTDYYWIRYRIVGGITTAPTFQQWKWHPSRFEINATAQTQYFGSGRYPRDLLVHIVLTEPVVGSAPGNANVAFASGITLSILRNQFNNSAVDAFGITIVIPVGIDTSNPLVLELGWYADTVNAGDVELTVDAAQLEVGDLWDGTVGTVQTAQVETVGAGTRYVNRLTSFEIDISALIPGETLALKVQRDATVGNDPPDTLAGNIIFGSVRARATFWRP